MEKKDRNLKYDIVRIVSMICIMLYHYTTRYNELIGHNGFSIYIPPCIATISVSIFLLMTGYFSKKQVDNNSKIDSKKYILKRIRRLYPTFLISLILTSIIIFFSNGKKITFVQLITNALLINRFFNIPFIDGAYWYMTIMVAYTLFFAIYLLFNNKNQKIIIYMYIASNIMFGGLKIFYTGIPEVFYFFAFNYINKCILGIIIADKSNNKYTKIIQVLLLIVGDFLMVNEEMFICDFIAIIIMIIVNLEINIVIKNKTVIKIITLFSSMSYFVYLFHQQAGFIIINFFEKINVLPIISIFLTLIIVLMVGVLYSITLTKIKKSTIINNNRC